MFKNISPRHLRLPIALTALFSLPWLLYGSNLSGWWRWDDTAILKYIIDTKWWKSFFIPSAWQELSAFHFTPWMTLSYEIDYALAGLNPLFFYIHHLMAFSLLLILTFIFLRIWCSGFVSFWGAVLFACGAPVMTTASQLMTRHYLEGTAFIIVSLICFHLAMNRNRSAWAVAGSIFYLLAMSAKEIFAPFILVLLFWPEKTWKERFPSLIPFGMCAIAYALWRFYMLSGHVGGYGELNTVRGFKDLVLLPWSIFNALIKDNFLSFSIWLGGISFVLFKCMKNMRILFFAVAVLIALITPLAFAGSTHFVPERFLLLSWWVLVTAISLSLSNTILPSRITGIKAVVGILLLGTSLSYTFSYQKQLESQIQRFDEIGRYTWMINSPAKSLYLPKMMDYYHYFYSLKWMKQEMTSRQGPMYIFSDLVEVADILAHQPRREVRIMMYEEESSTMKNMQSQLADKLDNWQANNKLAQLSLSFSYADDTLFWTFGPYQRGKYFLMIQGRQNISAKMQLPPSSSFHAFALDESFDCRLKYESPQGWYTYSPWLHVDLTQENTFQWRREESLSGTP